MVAHQQVKDDVGAGAAVEQVAHDVELVHGQPLDELAETDDELIGAAILDDAADDLITTACWRPTATGCPVTSR